MEEKRGGEIEITSRKVVEKKRALWGEQAVVPVSSIHGLVWSVRRRGALTGGDHREEKKVVSSGRRAKP